MDNQTGSTRAQTREHHPSTASYQHPNLTQLGQIQTGEYHLVNVDTGAYAGLINNNNRSELVNLKFGLNEVHHRGSRWLITFICGDEYKIQNVDFKSYASYDPDPQVGGHVIGKWNVIKSWRIRVFASSNVCIIAPLTNPDALWKSMDGVNETPLELGQPETAKKCRWELRKVAPNSPVRPQPILKAVSTPAVPASVVSARLASTSSAVASTSTVSTVHHVSLFAALVHALLTQAENRPHRSVIHETLTRQRPNYLVEAGFENWSSYAQAAEAVRVVELGVTGGGAWISLDPRFFLLVRVLREEPEAKPMRTRISNRLLELDPNHYSVDTSGFSSWRQLTTAAERCGIVVLGGDSDYSWIALTSRLPSPATSLSRANSVSTSGASEARRRTLAGLVQVIKNQESSRPLQSLIAQQMKSQYPDYFEHFPKWGDLVVAATTEGLVQTGGAGGPDWISSLV